MIQNDIAMSRVEIDQARLMTLQAARCIDRLGTKHARKQVKINVDVISLKPLNVRNFPTGNYPITGEFSQQGGPFDKLLGGFWGGSDTNMFRVFRRFKHWDTF
jgi:hypothetical protein